MWLTYLMAALVGAVIGSFLNVCIYRLPRGESIAWPGSHCPSCARAIAWYDNLPLLSFMVLRGRCRHCATPISWRYPVIEALNAAGYVILVWWFGLGSPTLAYAGLY